ncbi:hypothetical protein [Thermogymnomonas acidicola]|uniref:hypothetical protein n=1 Tax=Thermogymnomonas acidicola TaxID=399579 RepID=UPI00094663BF|nr:hypothetical protein [Thermogymnomonas acidicola]
MEDDILSYLRDLTKTMPDESMFTDAVRDLIKDFVKEVFRRKLSEDPKLRDEMTDALKTYLEGKAKEYEGGIAKMAKVTAKLGILSTPKQVRDEMLSEFINSFQKEIEEIVRRTF